ncbi:hypothetical protein SAMN05192529_11489 [Arachidicoccus rhizosphaerae]|uniref:Uncharacterized protein n=1 Tax=Arachidicoccus rhizosphaerae TaxID=551991 RepID=A0A1H4AF63_9BACT|nr:hypothetical protein SAMN05192529_11489 [Arachidicoccus rhizosphaerae]
MGSIFLLRARQIPRITYFSSILKFSFLLFVRKKNLLKVGNLPNALSVSQLGFRSRLFDKTLVIFAKKGTSFSLLRRYLKEVNS